MGYPTLRITPRQHTINIAAKKMVELIKAGDTELINLRWGDTFSCLEEKACRRAFTDVTQAEYDRMSPELFNTSKLASDYFHQFYTGDMSEATSKRLFNAVRKAYETLQESGMLGTPEEKQIQETTLDKNQSYAVFTGHELEVGDGGPVVGQLVKVTVLAGGHGVVQVFNTLDSEDYMALREDFHFLYFGKEMTIRDQLIEILLSDESIDQIVFGVTDQSSAVMVRRTYDYKFQVAIKEMRLDGPFLVVREMNGIPELVKYMADVFDVVGKSCDEHLEFSGKLIQQ